jgi:ParB family transcriptional regulator, chromosome partitioning protein
MAEHTITSATVQLIAPTQIKPNPENPRLIFRQEELEALEGSIREQGILVPLTIFRSREKFVILDGERRWRCALKLGLPRVPVIVQPEPTRFQNILMMFAIHNARQDWDPLPTAYKLRDLEKEFYSREGRRPTEAELAQLASMQRGEVRRLKKLLDLPEQYHTELFEELEKPKSQQKLTVDIVLETTKGVEALSKREVITPAEEEPLRRAIIDKFKSNVIKNTVEPRQLARIARAVEREEIPRTAARRVAQRLVSEPKFDIQQAYAAAAAQADQAHTIEQLADRVERRLAEYIENGYDISDSLRESLRRLNRMIVRALRSSP